MSGKDPLSFNMDFLVHAGFDDRVEDPFALQSHAEPIQEHLRRGCGTATCHVSSALTRKSGEYKHTTSPGYLQTCADIHALRDTSVTAISIQLHRRVPMTDQLVLPVDMVLPRLHNNPDAGDSPACGVLPTALSTARTLDVSGIVFWKLVIGATSIRVVPVVWPLPPSFMMVKSWWVCILEFGR